MGFACALIPGLAQLAMQVCFFPTFLSFSFFFLPSPLPPCHFVGFLIFLVLCFVFIFPPLSLIGSVGVLVPIRNNAEILFFFLPCFFCVVLPNFYFLFSKYTVNREIITSPNSTSPQVTISSTNSDSETVTFSISIREIREKSKNGAIISSYAFGDQDITVAANIRFFFFNK